MNKKKTNRISTGKWIAIFVISLFLAAVTWTSLNVFVFPMQESYSHTEEMLELREGTDIEILLENTDKIASIKQLELFRLVAKAYEKEIAGTNGRFKISNGITMFEFFQMIRNKAQAPIKLKINNLRTKEQLIALLDKELMLDKKELEQAFSDNLFLAKYNMNSDNAVLLFQPDTYEFYWNVSLVSLFDKFHKYYNRFWNEDRLRKADSLGLKPNEVAIIASIVEGETNKKAEFATIGRLYINRYQINMPLQADPTVKFAVGDFSLKRILNVHLETDSPYNTYKNLGLPPGPINLPNKATIDSVLNSQKHDYLYMVAKEDFSGYHNFAKTYREHNINANKYRAALNRRGIK